MTARDEAHAEALDALNEALTAALDDRQPIPCRVVSGSSLWLSDRHEDRHEAAEQCAGCPVLDACAEVGRHEPFGVWGGRDVTVRPGQKRTPTKAKSKPRTPPDPTPCAGCRRPFIPSRRGRQYCSQPCQTRTASARRRQNTNKEK